MGTREIVAWVTLAITFAVLVLSHSLAVRLDWIAFGSRFERDMALMAQRVDESREGVNSLAVATRQLSELVYKHQGTLASLAVPGSPTPTAPK